MNSEFHFSEDFEVNAEVKKAFDENGFIIIRNVLDSNDIRILKNALEHNDGVMSKVHLIDDAKGRKVTSSHWRSPGHDVTGMVARSEKVAGTFEKLLGGELYQYHAKVIMKEPRTGGTHHWHQDYGYWYHNTCIYPNMGTVWVAVDKASRQNGCLQLLAGSQKIGRIDHLRIDGKSIAQQTVVDPERLEMVKPLCQHVYVECEPGDAVFFHCNVLHCSSPNTSDQRRMAFLVAYNRADNNPIKEHHWSSYQPLNKVPNSAIRECTNITDLSEKGFMNAEKTYFTQGVMEKRGLVIKAEKLEMP